MGKKRKMQEPLDSLFVRGQQDFDLYEQLNPVEIKITDDAIINKLNKYKQIRYTVGFFVSREHSK